MFTATTNATPILSPSKGSSSVGKHDRRLSSMGKTKRSPSNAREASASDVRFCFFLSFACFFHLSCVFFGFPFLSLVFFPFGLPFSSFGLPFSCLVLSLLACSCVAIQECLAFYFRASCLYSLDVIPAVFSICHDSLTCKLICTFFFSFFLKKISILSPFYCRNTDHLVHRFMTTPRRLRVSRSP